MTNDSNVDPVFTFALRYVRMLLLKRLCNEGHTVLAVEKQLLDEAANKVRVSGLGGKKAAHTAKRLVIRRILNLSEDPDVQSSLLDEVESNSFVELMELH